MTRSYLAFLVTAVTLVPALAVALEEDARDPVLCRPTQAPIVHELRADGWVVAHLEFAAPRPTACDAFVNRGTSWTVQRCEHGVCEPFTFRHTATACGPRDRKRSCSDPHRIAFNPRRGGLYTVLVEVDLADHRLTDRAFIRVGARPERAR